MKLYHGSNIGNIKILEPKLADHDRPYVYMSTIEEVAAFYLCNAVERPYYWFPYGFDSESGVPVYHELYPNALQEVSEGVSGYIYEAETDEDKVMPFRNIPCARLAVKPIVVTGCRAVENAYKLFLDYEEQGKIRIGCFEDKTERELNRWYSMIAGYLTEKDMIKILDCSYAAFVREKIPEAWERYINGVK